MPFSLDGEVIHKSQGIHLFHMSVNAVQFCFVLHPFFSTPQINHLVVTLPMMMLILQKEMLISAVTRKRNARNPETREKTLEAVESAERAGVSPDFAVCLLACIQIALWVAMDCGRDGGRLEPGRHTCEPRGLFSRRWSGGRRRA